MSKIVSTLALLLFAGSLYAAPLTSAPSTPGSVVETSQTEELVRELTNKLHLLPHQTFALRLQLHGKQVPASLAQSGSAARSFEASLTAAQRQALQQLDLQLPLSLR